MNSLKNTLLIINFLEGASLMSVEIIAAKMCAPYFGLSIKVWAAILSITVGSLALGYSLGDYVKPKIKQLRLVILTALIYLTLVIFGGNTILSFFSSNLDLNIGIIVSSLFLLFVPIVCFGMTTPLIIKLNLKNDSKSGSGSFSGLFYGVSTLGGILAITFIGFYCIPILGLTFSMKLVVIALIISLLLTFGIRKQYLLFILLILNACNDNRPSDHGLSGKCTLGDEPTYSDFLTLEYFDGHRLISYDTSYIAKDHSFQFKKDLVYGSGIYAIHNQKYDTYIYLFLEKGNKLVVNTTQRDFNNYTVEGNENSIKLKDYYLESNRIFEDLKKAGDILTKELVTNTLNFSGEVYQSSAEENYDRLYATYKDFQKSYAESEPNNVLKLFALHQLNPKEDQFGLMKFIKKIPFDVSNEYEIILKDQLIQKLNASTNSHLDLKALDNYLSGDLKESLSLESNIILMLLKSDCWSSKQEIENVKNALKNSKLPYQIIAISVDKDMREWKRFSEEYLNDEILDFCLEQGADNNLKRLVPHNFIPSVYILNPSGKVLAQNPQREELSEFIINHVNE